VDHGEEGVLMCVHHPPDLGIHDQNIGHTSMPVAELSSAVDGNFLEVLNMCLNVFNKFYVDRVCDRTGQVSLVISPGSGVFEGGAQDLLSR
jgi:hypothetical protein